MVTSFIKDYSKLIVSHPQKLEVYLGETDGDITEIVIKADVNDVGKLIGKNGNMINALKTLVNGCKAKNGNSYKIQVLPCEQ